MLNHPARPVAVALLALAAACTGKENRGRGTAPQYGGRATPLASAITDTVEDGQWTMPAHDYASTRFSRLAQITTANVANLRLAWTFSTGVNRGHEAAPLVVNNTMYIVTPFPNLL
jgi:lanthanide-dependent methanol dehydrogenase